MPLVDRRRPRGDNDRSAMRHGIARIDDQIEQRHFQLIGVGRGLGQIAAGTAFRSITDGPNARSSNSAMPRTRDRYVDGLHVEFLAACEHQHALCQRRAALRTAHGIVDQALDRGVRITAAGDFKAADNGGQKVVEVVRDPAGELSESLHLL